VLKNIRIAAVKERRAESLLLTCVHAAWKLCTGVCTREVLRKQQVLGRIAWNPPFFFKCCRLLRPVPTAHVQVTRSFAEIHNLWRARIGLSE